MHREQWFTVSCNISERFHIAKFPTKMKKRYLIIQRKIKLARLLLKSDVYAKLMEGKSITISYLLQQLIQTVWTTKSWEDWRVQEKDLAVHLLFPFSSLQLHCWTLSEADHSTQKSHSHTLSVVQISTGPSLGIDNIKYKKHNVRLFSWGKKEWQFPFVRSLGLLTACLPASHIGVDLLLRTAWNGSMS